MPPISANAAQTPQDALSVIGRKKMVGMTLPDPQGDSPVSALFFDALRIAHGKVEAGAATVGKDRSNFTRDVKKLLEILDGLGPHFLAQLGVALVREYGVAIESPEQRGERVFDTLESGFKELRQLFQHLARQS